MRIYWIEEIDQGKIGIMPRPRGNDWLETEIRKLSLEQVRYVVSLLESQEIHELELEEEGALCEKHGIGFINFPIKDRSTPQDKEAYISLIERLYQLVENGDKIVIHCRMGIGRSSLVAAGVMVRGGIKASGIFDLISAYRTLEVPDTAAQISWFEEIKKSL